MLTAAYSMLRDDQDYQDLWGAHFQRGDHARLVAGHPPSAPPRLRGHPPPEVFGGASYLVAISAAVSCPRSGRRCQRPRGSAPIASRIGGSVSMGQTRAGAA